eukprot:8285349-Pyramimonas_sp.AAC.1
MASVSMLTNRSHGPGTITSRRWDRKNSGQLELPPYRDGGVEPYVAPRVAAVVVAADYVVAIIGCRAPITPSSPGACDVNLAPLKLSL